MLIQKPILNYIIHFHFRQWTGSFFSVLHYEKNFWFFCFLKWGEIEISLPYKWISKQNNHFFPLRIAKTVFSALPIYRGKLAHLKYVIGFAAAYEKRFREIMDARQKAEKKKKYPYGKTGICSRTAEYRRKTHAANWYLLWLGRHTGHYLN